MSMEMDNSVSECDAPDRFQDDSGWDEGDDWSDEEDGGEKPSCSAWKGIGCTESVLGLFIACFCKGRILFWFRFMYFFG